jgi:hypothetical protein
MNTKKLESAKELLTKPGVAYMCRLWSGVEGNRPVRVIPGKQAPREAGESYHWTTLGGKPIYHPNSYGWPMVYHHSTLCTEVGADWLLSRKNRAEYRIDDGIRMLAMPGRTVRVGTVRIVPGWVKGRKMAIAIRGRRTYHIARGKMRDLRADAPKLAAEAIEAWEKQDQHAKVEKIFLRDLPTTRVTLSDSRRAGNCVEGTLRFAETKLGIDRAAAISGGHLLTVPASLVMAKANGQSEHARRACYAAWLRETTVSI